jgi:predicted nucleotidyltransferase
VSSEFALDLARDFAARLRERFGDRVTWVRLYGSRARGDAHEDSDADVFAVVRDLTWREKNDAIDLGYDVSLARGVHVSPVVMSEADFTRLIELEAPFAKNVLQEGLAA